LSFQKRVKAKRMIHSKPEKTALITGATSGFGAAIAEKFAEAGLRLIITGRRDDRLRDLKKKLIEQNGVEVLTLNFDVRDKVQVDSAFASLPEDWKNIDILINNAGLAVGRNNLADGVVDDWERMIDTNLKGLLYVTRNIAPMMIRANKGHIINIGSIAGKEVYPEGNVYCATKFGVDALTQSLRMELVKDNIKVSQIAPGAADTEFSLVRFKGDTETATNVYMGFIPLSADDVAEAAWFIVSRPAHVCINDMVIMPTAQATATIFSKH